MSDLSFKRFCEVLEDISKTRKRLEIQEILSNYFRSVSECPQTLVAACYMCTCTFCPDFYNEELGIGESVITKIVCEVTGKKSSSVRELFRKSGDYANLAVQGRRKSLVPQKMDHSLIYARKHLQRIAHISGTNSLANKIRTMCQFCMRCTNIELKYILRIYEGKLKIGIALKTVLISLSLAFFPNDPNLFEKIKSAYNRRPVFEDIVEALSSNLDITEAICIKPTIPIKPMLAQASKNLTAAFKKVENNKFVCEHKYDGERAQIHFIKHEIDKRTNVEPQTPSEQKEMAILKPNKKLINSLLSFSKIKDSNLSAIEHLADQNGKNEYETGNSLKSDSQKHENQTRKKHLSIAVKDNENNNEKLNGCLTNSIDSKAISNKHKLSGESIDENSSISSNKSAQSPNLINDSKPTNHHSKENHQNYELSISFLERDQENIDCKSRIFSRNSEDITAKYPDLIPIIFQMSKNTQSFILDCEIVAYNINEHKILPFQLLTTRKRKDVKIDNVSIKVCIFVFDCLFFNEKSLLETELRERRKILTENFHFIKGIFEFVNNKECTSPEEIDDYFNEAITNNAEGIMIKNLDGLYKPSLRSTSWIKLKKDYLEGMSDTFDLVVIGAYYGKGKRTGTYGGFLLACYNESDDSYEAICKIGTGFDDNNLLRFYNQFSKDTIPPQEKHTFNIIATENVQPDVWIAPKHVWEIKAAGLSTSPIYSAASKISTSGISLRFPRFIRERSDKKNTDATTSDQIYTTFNETNMKDEELSDEFN